MVINRSDCQTYYPFEGTVNDASGNANNGTVTGTNQYADSINGRGFDFDGATYIDTGITVTNNSNPFTMLIRGEFLDFSAEIDNKAFFSNLNTGGGNAGLILLFEDSTNKLNFYLRNAADTAYALASISATTVSQRDYAALMVWFDPSTEVGIARYDTAGVYTSATTSISDSTFADDGNNIFIGTDLGASPSNYMNKVMDDFVYIDNAVLTDEDFYRFYIGLGISDL